MKIAKHDCYGTEKIGDAEVRRFFKAGDPIPASIDVASSDVRTQDGPEPSGPIGTTGAQPSVEFDVDSASVEELEAEAERLGLQVDGTGANGNVLKSDLQDALRASRS